MQINWFTVIAQIINFFILVWLLKRYLYKPILNAVDDREKRIKSQLADAEAKKDEAKEERDKFSLKNEMFDKQKNDLMRNAVAEVKHERQKLLEEARNEGNAKRTKLEISLKEMQLNLTREIAQKAQQEVFAITRKTLVDLADLNLEQQAVKVFIRRLNSLKREEKNSFLSAFRAGANPILVRTSFELSPKLQIEIQKTVMQVLEAETLFQFMTTPELVSGIELSTNGYKLTWSVSAYLTSLQKNISETIKRKK